ncbi:MAG: Release factor glutamine methyltransferase [Planctomycetes bacterium ADurb.Bin126]|nr:MAG: Release factor glutamine methyltransferase [Planctomycetes bacterium ADurb.Bin126]HOD84103.1 hypothetical protein [Phycisphaerae bacterium]HQL75325.1 hypothetical protein [Phycisphaerae bacterium]
MAEPWTVLRLLNWTREHFVKAGVDEPRLAAEVLLACALRCPRIMLYARFEYQPNAEELAAFRERVKRAAAHEPVAYLVGEKEFYSLAFAVTPAVLIPRDETELGRPQAGGCGGDRGGPCGSAIEASTQAALGKTITRERPGCVVVQ